MYIVPVTFGTTDKCRYRRIRDQLLLSFPEQFMFLSSSGPHIGRLVDVIVINIFTSVFAFAYRFHLDRTMLR